MSMGRRVQRARTNALEQLYRDGYARFLRVAVALVGRESEGVDVVQEAFARALHSLDRFRSDGTLEAWVWRIVVNTAFEQRRRAAKEPFGPVEDVSQNGHEDELGVRRWVAALPERQRAAVFLRYYAGLDYRSIGLALGVETGTVSATLSAAHAALRKNLEGVPS